MNYLQLVRVLHANLDDIPGVYESTQSRNLSATHLTARRVGDHARKMVR